MVSGIIPGLLMFIGVLAASTALGAAAGAAIGALAFGIGAAPGAAAGAGLGFEAGIALLDFLGLAFLVGYIGKSLLEGATVAGEAVQMAWHSVDNRRTQRMTIDRAANRLAFSVGLVFRGVLQGIIAFLLAKGSAAAASRVPELVSKLRASKLGAGFALWIEKNWKRLVEEPKLRHEQQAAGTGGFVQAPESPLPKRELSQPHESKEPPQESKSKPPARTPAKLAEGFAKRARPAEVRTAERLTTENSEFDGRTFDVPPPPDPGFDWKDDLGRTYDAMGDGTKSRFFKLEQFTSSIDSHLLKGNDFTVIDMTGYTPEQVAAVSKYVDGLPASSQALIRRIGF